mgnify:CR=1 FL=1
MTTAWTARDVAGIDPAASPTVPVIERIARAGLDDALVYWDMWPVQDSGGMPAQIAGRELWMALTAPDRGDPALRHFEAKIRLLERRGGGWRDLGPVLPDWPDAPYEREWAGSALFDGSRFTLFFTAAGTRERPGGYQQQLYEASAGLGADGLPSGWTRPRPSITRWHPAYMAADAHEGEAGRIKAFRDPAHFRDPADGADYLIFTASLAGAASEYNGAVGIARRGTDGWELLPPLIHADGVNNELERAHIVHHGGRYFAFWATQSGTFAPGLRHAPNGLYGMVADSLAGPWQPLGNGGLVLHNPAAEPLQTYSWFVAADLVVSSFVDFWGLRGHPLPSDPIDAAVRFGGVPAPLLQLRFADSGCSLVPPMPA